MTRILDTNICIFLLTGRHPQVARRFRQMGPGQVRTTTVTAAELRYGALHSNRQRENLDRLARFLAPLAPLPFDDRAAAHFAAIKDHLARKGCPIGPMDLLIASVVRSMDAILVTDNEREFTRVKDLGIENWRR